MVRPNKQTFATIALQQNPISGFHVKSWKLNLCFPWIFDICYSKNWIDCFAKSTIDVLLNVGIQDSANYTSLPISTICSIQKKDSFLLYFEQKMSRAYSLLWTAYLLLMHSPFQGWMVLADFLDHGGRRRGTKIFAFKQGLRWSIPCCLCSFCNGAAFI